MKEVKMTENGVICLQRKDNPNYIEFIDVYSGARISINEYELRKILPQRKEVAIIKAEDGCTTLECDPTYTGTGVCDLILSTGTIVGDPTTVTCSNEYHTKEGE